MSVRTSWLEVPLLLLGLVLLQGVLAFSTAQAADAAPPAPPAPPEQRVYWSSLNLFRLNPLGLESQNRLMYHKRLMQSDSMLFRDTFAAGGLSFKLNPAYLKVGPVVDIQPVALFNLRTGYEFLYYFGSLGYLQSVPLASEPYDDGTRGDDVHKPTAYSTSGHHVFVEPTLQVKVKNVVVRNKFAFEYWNMALNAGDTVFYDATLDTWVPGNGTVMANDTDLLYLNGPLTVGVRLAGVWPGYTDTELGGATDVDNSHMRVGPLVAYTIPRKEGKKYRRPTFLANVAWYVDHRHRMGAMPYILLAYSFTADYLKP